MNMKSPITDRAPTTSLEDNDILYVVKKVADPVTGKRDAVITISNLEKRLFNNGNAIGSGLSDKYIFNAYYSDSVDGSIKRGTVTGANVLDFVNGKYEANPVFTVDSKLSVETKAVSSTVPGKIEKVSLMKFVNEYILGKDSLTNSDIGVNSSSNDMLDKLKLTFSTDDSNVRKKMSMRDFHDHLTENHSQFFNLSVGRSESPAPDGSGYYFQPHFWIYNNGHFYSTGSGVVEGNLQFGTMNSRYDGIFTTVDLSTKREVLNIIRSPQSTIATGHLAGAVIEINPSMSKNMTTVYGDESGDTISPTVKISREPRFVSALNDEVLINTKLSQESLIFEKRTRNLTDPKLRKYTKFYRDGIIVYGGDNVNGISGFSLNPNFDINGNPLGRIEISSHRPFDTNYSRANKLKITADDSLLTFGFSSGYTGSRSELTRSNFRIQNGEFSIVDGEKPVYTVVNGEAISMTSNGVYVYATSEYYTNYKTKTSNYTINGMTFNVGRTNDNDISETMTFDSFTGKMKLISLEVGGDLNIENLSGGGLWSSTSTYANNSYVYLEDTDGIRTYYVSKTDNNYGRNPISNGSYWGLIPNEIVKRFGVDNNGLASFNILPTRSTSSGTTTTRNGYANSITFSRYYKRYKSGSTSNTEWSEDFSFTVNDMYDLNKLSKSLYLKRFRDDVYSATESDDDPIRIEIDNVNYINFDPISEIIHSDNTNYNGNKQILTVTIRKRENQGTGGYDNGDAVVANQSASLTALNFAKLVKFSKSLTLSNDDSIFGTDTTLSFETIRISPDAVSTGPTSASNGGVTALSVYRYGLSGSNGGSATTNITVDDIVNLKELSRDDNKVDLANGKQYNLNNGEQIEITTGLLLFGTFTIEALYGEFIDSVLVSQHGGSDSSEVSYWQPQTDASFSTPDYTNCFGKVIAKNIGGYIHAYIEVSMGYNLTTPKIQHRISFEMIFVGNSFRVKIGKPGTTTSDESIWPRVRKSFM